MKYTPMMLATYQKAFGRSEDVSIGDATSHNTMNNTGFEPVPDYDYLWTFSGDLKGIKAWANLKSVRN